MDAILGTGINFKAHRRPAPSYSFHSSVGDKLPRQEGEAVTTIISFWSDLNGVALRKELLFGKWGWLYLVDQVLYKLGPVGWGILVTHYGIKACIYKNK